MPFGIRRGWVIPARREGDDGGQQRDRRLLDDELVRWGAGLRGQREALQPQRREPAPEAADEGPIRLGSLFGGRRPQPTQRDIAQSFAQRDILSQQAAAFRGEQPGAREAAQFGETVRALPEQDRTRLQAIARELDREGMTPRDLVAGLGVGAEPGIVPAELRNRALRVVERVTGEKVQVRREAPTEPPGGLYGGRDLTPEERAARQPPGPLDYVQAGLEKERETFQPYTRPAGRFLGEALTRTATSPLAFVPGQPGRERAIEIGGDVGAAVAGEVLLPSNLIPIPIIDPLIARALGVTLRAGQAVARPVLERLSARAARLAAESADPAVREAAEAFSTAASADLASSARGAPLETAAGREPVPDVGVVQPVAPSQAVSQAAEAAEAARPAAVMAEAAPPTRHVTVDVDGEMMEFDIPVGRPARVASPLGAEAVPDARLAQQAAPPPPEFGTSPAPQFGSTQREFLGEQGGIQERMFTPEEAGQRGQIGLEDVVTPGPPASKFGIDFDRSRQALEAGRALVVEERGGAAGCCKAPGSARRGDVGATARRRDGRLARPPRSDLQPPARPRRDGD